MADADSTSTPSPDSVSFALRYPTVLRAGEGSYLGDDDTSRQAEKATKRAAKTEEAIAARAEQERKQYEQDIKAPHAALEGIYREPRPGVPNPEKVPNPPKPEDYQKLSMGYLGAMVLLGAFGGKFIRGGGNAALSAFNGALKGWQEGNLEAYQNASAEWKEKQQQVLDNNRAQLDKYRAILDDRSASAQEQLDRLRLASAEGQDRLMYDRTISGSLNTAAQLYDKREAIHTRAVKTTQDLVDQLTQQNESAVERANQLKQYLATPQGQQELSRLPTGLRVQLESFVEHNADQAPAQLPAPGPAGGSMPTEPPPGTAIPAVTTPLPAYLRGPPPANLKPADRAARQFMIESYQAGKGEPSSADWAAFNRQQHQPRSAAGISLAEFIAERRAVTGTDPTSAEIRQFQADSAAQVAASRTFGVRQMQIETQVQEFANVVPIAAEASRNVPRGKFVPINRLMNNVRLMRSDPAYQNFVDANEAAITAYSGTMSRTGANTVHAQERADRVLSTATSDEAYQSGLRMLQREVEAVERSPRDALKKIKEIFGPEGVAQEGSTGERFKKSGWSKEGDVEPPRSGGGWSAQEIR